LALGTTSVPASRGATCPPTCPRFQFSRLAPKSWQVKHGILTFRKRFRSIPLVLRRMNDGGENPVLWRFCFWKLVLEAEDGHAQKSPLTRSRPSRNPVGVVSFLVSPRHLYLTGGSPSPRRRLHTAFCTASDTSIAFRGRPTGSILPPPPGFSVEIKYWLSGQLQQDGQADLRGKRFVPCEVDRIAWPTTSWVSCMLPHCRHILPAQKSRDTR